MTAIVAPSVVGPHVKQRIFFILVGDGSWQSMHGDAMCRAAVPVWWQSRGESHVLEGERPQRMRGCEVYDLRIRRVVKNTAVICYLGAENVIQACDVYFERLMVMRIMCALVCPSA